MCAQADADQQGQFRIEPPNQTPSLFGSEEDILVSREFVYFVGGRPESLADLLILHTGREIVLNEPNE